MKAAVVRELGTLPEVAESDEVEGDDVLEVVAAPLNPIDVAVSNGRFFGGHPSLPYVPGCEAVGRTRDGKLVWVFSGGLGVARNGTMAERFSLGTATAIDLPDGADPALAGALGIAGLAGWLPLSWRAPLEGGETVLVLGATGTVGIVAVQAAKLLGAGRVVAAGRSAAGLERASAAGADATVSLDEADDLAAAFRDACGGDGPTYVFDPLWGEPLAAAVDAAARNARIVNLGQSAGPHATLASGAIRGKQLSLFGHTNFAVPQPELAEQYQRLVSHAIAGKIRLDVERVPLDEVAGAWQQQAAGAGRKLVVVP
jgi:NADPH2:quinone reductase